MNELSLHILDIVNNSVKAGASLILLNITEEVASDLLTIVIEDNGCGMDKDFLAEVLDPFKTTRTTRKVGMGLSLFKSAAEQTGGTLTIESEKNVGTKVCATFGLSHIDRQPLGDVASSVTTVLSGNSAIDFVYSHTTNGKNFTMDTKEIRKILGDAPIGAPEILLWINDYINEGVESTRS